MNFMDLKFQRAVWATLFKDEMDENRLDEIIAIFWEHYNKVKKLSLIFFINKDLKEEIENSKKFFCEKMSKLAENYFSKEDYKNAYKCYQNIYKANPNDRENLKKCLECTKKVGPNDLKVAVAKLLAKDGSCESYRALGEAYKDNKQFKEAIATYKKFMSAYEKTHLGGEYTMLACMYWDKFHEAKKRLHEDADNLYKCFMKALDYEPNGVVYIRNAISACYVTGHHEEEIHLWDRYKKLSTLSEEDKFSYGATLFKTRRFEEFAQYVNAKFTKPSPSIYPNFSIPEWTGQEDIKDKRLLVHYEQGFGDTILYWGYAPRLKKIAKKVIYIVQPAMYDLLKDNEWGVEVYPSGTDLNTIGCDYHVPTMSLPVPMKLTYENMSPIGGYIKVNPADVEKFKKRHFKDNKFKIGIAFKGNALGNQKRDVPIEDMVILDKMKNVEFYCLSKDVTDIELKHFKRNKVHNVALDFDNFKDTAIAMEAMDLIITMDNCILNLAGAIGKRALGLFNYHYEPRWYDLNENDCGWFKCVKPIINERFDEWGVTVKKAMIEAEKIRKEMNK